MERPSLFLIKISNCQKAFTRHYLGCLPNPQSFSKTFALIKSLELPLQVPESEKKIGWTVTNSIISLKFELLNFNAGG